MKFLQLLKFNIDHLSSLRMINYDIWFNAILMMVVLSWGVMKTALLKYIHTENAPGSTVYR